MIHSKCDIIVNQDPFPRNDIPLVERSTPPIPDEDHVDVSHAQESVTSSQKYYVTQSREPKHQSSNEYDTNISRFAMRICNNIITVKIHPL